MALKPIRPRLRNISNDVAKVQLVIPAGDEVEVSQDVADQLARQGAPLRDASASPAQAPPSSEAADSEPPRKAPAKKATAKKPKADAGA